MTKDITKIFRDDGKIDIKLFKTLVNSGKRLVCAVAPSARVTIGEYFGDMSRKNAEEKIVAGLKALGFDYVLDINFTADLTALEEAKELKTRLETKTNLPMLTSCCPVWVRYIENSYKNLLKNLCSCKSPQQMMAYLVKKFYAKELGLREEDIIFATIMPCNAKKLESKISGDDADDVYTDLVFTINELCELFDDFGIDFVNLNGMEFDKPFGNSSAESVYFGASKGVAMATMHYLAQLYKYEDVEVEFANHMKYSTIKTANFFIDEKMVSVAVVDGMKDLSQFLNDVESGVEHFDFIEVMACEGGCVNGGGMPEYDIENRVNVLEKRTIALKDIKMTLKNSAVSNNKDIENFYKKFGGDILAIRKALHVSSR